MPGSRRRVALIIDLIGSISEGVVLSVVGSALIKAMRLVFYLMPGGFTEGGGLAGNGTDLW